MRGTARDVCEEGKYHSKCVWNVISSCDNEGSLLDSHFWYKNRSSLPVLQHLLDYGDDFWHDRWQKNCLISWSNHKPPKQWMRKASVIFKSFPNINCTLRKAKTVRSTDCLISWLDYTTLTRVDNTVTVGKILISLQKKKNNIQFWFRFWRFSLSFPLQPHKQFPYWSSWIIIKIIQYNSLKPFTDTVTHVIWKSGRSHT